MYPEPIEFSEISELVKQSLVPHGKCWDSASGNLLFLPDAKSHITLVFHKMDLSPELMSVGSVFVFPRNDMALFLKLAQYLNVHFLKEPIEHPSINSSLFSVLPREPVMQLSTWCRQLGPSTKLLSSAVEQNNLLLAYLLVYHGTSKDLVHKTSVHSVAALIRIPPEFPNGQHVDSPNVFRRSSGGLIRK